MKTFIEEVRDLMMDIRVAEGMNPNDFWFRTPENISETTRLYFLKFIEGGYYVVMETAVCCVSLNEWLEPQGCLKKYEYEVPEVGTDGVVYKEELFKGSFIDACKYLLFRKRKRGLARRPRRKKEI